MFRNNRIILPLIILLFAVWIIVQHYSSKPVDWRINCNSYSKSPYGCYVLNDMFKILFPEQVIEYNNECFAASLDTSISDSRNLIIISPGFKPDNYDINALLNFVAKGNHLFISSTYFDDSFLDTLNVKLTRPLIDSSMFKPGKEMVFLKEQKVCVDSVYRYNRNMPLYSFSDFDSLHIAILGANRDGGINFICISLGKGKIYLHSQPLVFTNYHLLYGNTNYASIVLSYLPVQRTIWDNYYKPDRFVNTSPVRYILTQPALRTSYYLLLFTLLLYLVIESKRRQRFIPVIKPPENRSLEYVKTIGDLYFHQHDHADLAKKKVIYLKEFLREQYYITQLTNTPEFVGIVASKTGVATAQVSQLLKMVQHYETTTTISEDNLIDFNQKLELFYEQCL